MFTSTERRRRDRRVAERRRFPRLAAALWMEEISGDNHIYRRSTNISEGGAYFENAIPHTIGQIVMLCFEVPGAQMGLGHGVTTRGKVVNTSSSSGFGMGVQFLSLDSDDRRWIREFVHSAIGRAK